MTDKQVRDTILTGFGGGSEEHEVIDLMELVAMLLIPIFLKAAKMDTSGDNETDIVQNDDSEQANPVEQNAKVPPESARKLPEGVAPSPPGMLPYVLNMILDDVSPSTVSMFHSLDVV